MTPTELRENRSTIDRIADVPLERIRQHPRPGTATEEDLLDPENKLCELIDGTIVEKAMGFPESRLGGYLFLSLGNFILAHDLGELIPADGMIRLQPGLVRIPDIAFYAWSDYPEGVAPIDQQIANVVPRLAIEILSPSNRSGEMRAKRIDLFTAGTDVIWEIDPDDHIIRVYTDAQTFTTLAEGDTLTGGMILPGFSIPVEQVFTPLRRR